MARMALDADGKFLAMDVDMIADMGAYLSTFGPYIPHGGAGMLPGLYDIPGLPLPRPRGVHQHRAGRRLSRRGPAGSRLCDRAAGRCCRAKARHDAGCGPAQELHPAEGDAVHDRDRQGLRFRRVRRAPEARAGHRRLEGVSQARQGREEAGPRPRHRPGDLCRDLRHHGRRRPPMSSSIPTATSPS